MKLIKYFSLLVISVIIVWSCDDDYEFINGEFPETAVNFEEINSEYDDYNSAAPDYLYHEFNYLFSSNRNSLGEEFDILNYIVTLTYTDYSKEAKFQNLLDKQFHILEMQ